MSISKDVLLKKSALIAAIFFMLLGVYGIVTAALTNNLEGIIIVLNIFLFLPILLRNQSVHLFVLGIVYTLFWGYVFFAGLYTVVANNMSFNVEMFLGACILFFAFINSIILLWSGIHISTERKHTLLSKHNI